MGGGVTLSLPVLHSGCRAVHRCDRHSGAHATCPLQTRWRQLGRAPSPSETVAKLGASSFPARPGFVLEAPRPVTAPGRWLPGTCFCLRHAPVHGLAQACWQVSVKGLPRRTVTRCHTRPAPSSSVPPPPGRSNARVHPREQLALHFSVLLTCKDCRVTVVEVTAHSTLV